MLTPRHKIKKQDPDALEESVAQALYELQVSSEKLKQSLREVQICSAKVGGTVSLPNPALSDEAFRRSILLAARRLC